MGDIPDVDNMISSIIIHPKPSETIAANENFEIQVVVRGLRTGNFTNPLTTYYSAPQQLQNGQVVGHTHVTIQQLDKLTDNAPPDPKEFVFFKGINDNGDGKGLLSTTVLGGLAPGVYRVCTLTSAANHQPVIMPVAQRGPQDDCQRFSVVIEAEVGPV